MALPGHIIPWKDIWLYLDTLSHGKTYGSTWTHYPVKRHMALPGHIILWKDIWLYLDTLSRGKTYCSTWTHYPVERHMALPGHIILIQSQPVFALAP